MGKIDKYGDIESPYTGCNNITKIWNFKNVSLYLVYRDSNARISNRKINLNSFTGYYLDGFCHLRNAERSFCIDRVISIADGKTGEIINDPCEYLKGIYEKSEIYVLDTIYNKYFEVLRIIIHTIRIDGNKSQIEKKKLHNLIMSLNDLNIQLDDKSIDDFVNDEMWEFKSMHAFRLGVGRAIKMENLPFNFINKIEVILETGKKINSSTFNTLEYIKKRKNKYNLQTYKKE